jgi:hypothetical protein
LGAEAAVTGRCIRDRPFPRPPDTRHHSQRNGAPLSPLMVSIRLCRLAARPRRRSTSRSRPSPTSSVRSSRYHPRPRSRRPSTPSCGEACCASRATRTPPPSPRPRHPIPSRPRAQRPTSERPTHARTPRRARDYEVRRYEAFAAAEADMEAAGGLNREVLRGGQVRPPKGYAPLPVSTAAPSACHERRHASTWGAGVAAHMP